MASIILHKFGKFQLDDYLEIVSDSDFINTLSLDLITVNLLELDEFIILVNN